MFIDTIEEESTDSSRFSLRKLRRARASRIVRWKVLSLRPSGIVTDTRLERRRLLVLLRTMRTPKLEYEQEGYMAKAQLFKVGEYAMKLHDMIEGDDDLPEWMQYKIAIMSQMIGDVYHALDYDLQTGQFDQQQDDMGEDEVVYDSVQMDEY